MEQYLKNFKNCLQKEIPYCAAACPFQIDIPDFIEKMKRGGFKGAFNTYRDSVGFPLIASNLCHEPCKEACPGKETDRSIELLMLEKACISFTGDKVPPDYNLPAKKKKIAVIGAGISGLACALRICRKKYEVEIFECRDRIGGALWDLMIPQVFLQDLEEQFRHETYTLHLNTTVASVEDLAERGFDAVYAATGAGGNDFGLLSAAAAAVPGKPGEQTERREKYCAVYGNTGWFAGGGLIGDEPVYALANGLHMGTVIDHFLKTGNLLNPENVRNTKMCLDPAKKIQEPPVRPVNGTGYQREEAKKEAGRCLECQCDFCRTYCDLTEFYNKWPLRIRDEILATTLPGSAEVKATPAKRLMSTCTQCGLCKETCPEEIDLGGLILEGRKSMHLQKKVPWVFHDFWLRDMDFANSGPAAAVAGSGSKYAFFPGCQLGASDPALVEKAYEYLVSKRPGTGLMLRCCGAPAEWSGDEDKFAHETKAIRGIWNELGRPTLIMACPTCEKKFKTHLQEVPVVSLYEIIVEWGLNEEGKTTPGSSGTVQNAAFPHTGKLYSIFDPCAARQEEEMRKSVRELAKIVGLRLEPLTENDRNARCCGYGGQPGIANPEFAEFVAQKRISESDNPYITYCINCRDIFAAAGKEAVHILNILFGGGAVHGKQATVSQRRENRIELAQRLLEKYWNTVPEEREKKRTRNVRIPEALAQKLSRERILEEEIIEVLDYCERTGRRVYHPEKRTYSGYSESGHMTCWVEYRLSESADEAGRADETDQASRNYTLVNAYTHRMKIELEPVWKGKKLEPEL